MRYLSRQVTVGKIQGRRVNWTSATIHVNGVCGWYSVGIYEHGSGQLGMYLGEGGAERGKILCTLEEEYQCLAYKSETP